MGIRLKGSGTSMGGFGGQELGGLWDKGGEIGVRVGDLGE